MFPSPLRLPDRLVRATTVREGKTGREWLARLPGLVEQALDAWGCVVTGDPTCGEVALVVPVEQYTTPAALKISFRHPGNLGEAPALRHLDGRGAVRLLAASDDGLTLLLERAGPADLGSTPTVAESIEVCGELARRLAVPAPAGATALADTANGWREQLEQQARDAPGAVGPRPLARARETITLLSTDATTTLLHADLHDANVLAAAREPWLVIDPRGWRGTAAFETFTVVAGRRDELDPDHLDRELRGRIARFAAAAHVDRELALACCQARATSTIFYQRSQPRDWFDDRVLRVLVEL